MPIAYLILAHDAPRQCARLVQRLTSAGDDAYLHVDAAAEARPFADALADAGIGPERWRFVEPRLAGVWGDFSLVAMTLRAARAALSSGVPYDHISLHSGRDYPLRSAGALRAALSATPGAEYLDAFPLPFAPWGAAGGLDRVRGHHLHGWRPALLRYPGGRLLAALLSRVGPRLPKRARLPPGTALYGGSQWWTLTAGCVRYLLGRLDQHPGYVRFFRHALIPDELFFQTLLMNSPYAERVAPAGNQRYVVWEDDKPRLLGPYDAAAAMASGRWFGRKFDDAVKPGGTDAVDTLVERGREPGAPAAENS